MTGPENVNLRFLSIQYCQKVHIVLLLGVFSVVTFIEVFPEYFSDVRHCERALNAPRVCRVQFGWRLESAYLQIACIFPRLLSCAKAEG